LRILPNREVRHARVIRIYRQTEEMESTDNEPFLDVPINLACNDNDDGVREGELGLDIRIEIATSIVHGHEYKIV